MHYRAVGTYRPTLLFLGISPSGDTKADFLSVPLTTRIFLPFRCYLICAVLYGGIAPTAGNFTRARGERERETERAHKELRLSLRFLPVTRSYERVSFRKAPTATTWWLSSCRRKREKRKEVSSRGCDSLKLSSLRYIPSRFSFFPDAETLSISTVA